MTSLGKHVSSPSKRNIKARHLAVLEKAERQFRAGDFKQAEELCRQVLEENPVLHKAQQLLVEIHLVSQRPQAVIQFLQNTVRNFPDDAPSYFQLGSAYMGAGDLHNAIMSFRKAIDVDPKYGDAWSRLCGLLGQTGEIDDSILAGQRAVDLLPHSASAHANLAAALDSANFTQQAMEHYRAAARLWPDHPVLQCCLGDALIGIGDKSGADACYRKAIDLQTSYTPPYRQLARLHHYNDSDHKDFTRIRRLLGNASLPEQSKTHLHFALGKMYEDCHEYDEAFRHYARGNLIENRRKPFNKKSLDDLVENTVRIFTPDFLKEMEHIGNPSQKPVFIIGMPRSGTTLVEQIVASHPAVYGAGELYWFGQAEHRLYKLLGSEHPFPGNIALLDRAVRRQVVRFVPELSGSAGP